MDNKEKKADLKLKLNQAVKLSESSFLPEKKRQNFVSLVKKYRAELKKIK